MGYSTSIKVWAQAGLIRVWGRAGTRVWGRADWTRAWCMSVLVLGFGL